MADSQYAYLCTDRFLYRVKIDKELKIELVFSNLPVGPALFNYRHILYSIGGNEGFTFDYSSRMYLFDTSRFQQLPIENIEYRNKPQDCEYMAEPRVIRGVEDRIYLLSVNRRDNKPIVNKGLLVFQSFDPINDCFEALPSPPIPTGHVFLPRALSHFILGEYIYLFIVDPFYSKCPAQAYTFNTKSLKWKGKMSWLDQFKKKRMTPPFGHQGDIGLSDEFNDETHILVAFQGINLTAYRVKIHADGNLEPKSYRILEESCYRDGDDYSPHLTRLADIGCGKFCVVTGSNNVSLLMYVFQIDFVLEHRIQTSPVSVGTSSSILYYKKFQLVDNVDCFCIVSAPPAIEDQDMEESTSKRERSGDVTVQKTKILRSL